MEISNAWIHAFKALLGSEKDLVRVVQTFGNNPSVLTPLYLSAEEIGLHDPLNTVLKPRVFADVALKLHVDPTQTAATLIELMELRLERPGTVMFSKRDRWINVTGDNIIYQMKKEERGLQGDTSYSNAFSQAFKEIVRD